MVLLAVLPWIFYCLPLYSGYLCFISSRNQMAQSHINGKDIQYETHLWVSSKSAGENLIKLAEINEIDKIYVSVKKRSKAGKLLLGSTAQHVVLHAPCPVVTVK
jgi:hypothetical protein